MPNLSHSPLPAHGDHAAPDSWLFAGSQIDLEGLRAALVRHRWLVLLICGAGLLLGLTVTVLTVPTYRAESSIQIDQQASRVLDAPDIEPVQAVQDADRFLQTQTEILRSRALAIRVAETLGLFGGNGFLEAMHVKPLSGAMGTLGAGEAHREQVIAVLRDNLSITLPDGSRVARIAFDSPDPAMAAKVANAFANTMISSNLSRRFDTSVYARQFLREQLEQAKERLEESERSMVGYARSSGIIDTDAIREAGSAASGAPSLVASSLIESNDALSQARSRRIDAEQLWTTTRSAPLMSLPEVLSNPAIQTMMERRAELEGSYAEQSQRRQNDHPDLIRLRSEIAALNQRIAHLAEDIRSSIRNRFRAAELQEQQMQGEVERLRNATLSEQDRSIRYTILRREVRTNRELYDGLLQRFKEVSAAAGVSANNISIVDLASTPVRPVAPNLPVNLGLSLLAAFVAAIGVIYLRENLDDMLRTVDDAERKLGVTGLGMVPRLDAGVTFRDEVEKRNSSLSEAIHTIRSAIELAGGNGPPRTVFITSCGKGEGKTSTAYALARDFAQIGRRVLLVDADMRRPSMHKLLSFENNAGLADLLNREKAIEDVVRRTAIADLHFVSAGAAEPNPAELLASGTLPWLIGQLEEMYDIVIIDGPPMLGLADAPSIAVHVEATLFVIDAGQTRRKTIRSALRRLRLSRATLRGVILNRVDVRTLGYGYESYYRYDEEARRPRSWLGRR
ncbi:MAG: polysaccharide biosynthesis tyrosine autokinase [Novosphingobium sp.]|uniref:GumC family protein n=1 Tax=Novosphingobium sp. TaxID=1874826 RepID=UPI0012D01F90|nr:polysaccharide biosynthesis tyrosine autokinase [Novosphingobium sp.]MPS68107.1 polysaccharide biosynthesis tyrosine autokinase [Novosphingobium sp.]